MLHSFLIGRLKRSCPSPVDLMARGPVDARRRGKAGRRFHLRLLTF
jgi:hypothetical protein